jgi:hypothetical protein
VGGSGRRHPRVGGRRPAGAYASELMDALFRASQALPTWVRVASISLLPVVAFFTNAALGTGAFPPMVAAFLGLSVLALWAHLPVFRFDGPMPFSDLGVHASGGRIIPWDEVQAVEPLEGAEKDLEAVLVDGERVKLRVRGARTREEFRAALSRHRPDLVKF